MLPSSAQSLSAALGETAFRRSERSGCNPWHQGGPSRRYARLHWTPRHPSSQRVKLNPILKGTGIALVRDDALQVLRAADLSLLGDTVYSALRTHRMVRRNRRYWKHRTVRPASSTGTWGCAPSAAIVHAGRMSANGRPRRFPLASWPLLEEPRRTAIDWQSDGESGVKTLWKGRSAVRRRATSRIRRRVGRGAGPSCEV